MDSVRLAIATRLTSYSDLTAKLATPESVYFRVGPQGATPPFVLFSKQSGTPERTFKDVVSSELWNIRAVSPNASEAEDVGFEIDVALDGYSLPVDGRTTLYLRKESDLNFGDLEDGVTWHYVGGLYRLLTQ